MSFKDCLFDHVAAGRLTKGQAEALTKQHEALTQKYVAAGQAEGAAKKAAEDILQITADKIQKKHRNLVKHGLKQKSFVELFKSMTGKIDSKVRHVYQTAANRASEVKGSTYKMMDEISDTLGGGFFEMSRGTEQFKDGLRAMSGEKVGDPNAAKVGKVVQQTMEYLHTRHKNAGGIMGKVKNYFPQVHAAEAIRKVDKDTWVNFLMKNDYLDRERMINSNTGVAYNDVDLTNVLGNIYEDIISGGQASAARRFEAGGSVHKRGGDIDLRNQSSRFIQFKNTDKFLKYNEVYGVGDGGLINSFFGSVDSLASDIGMMEVMGPKPDAMSRFFDGIMEAQGAGNAGRMLSNSNYRMLRGVGKGAQDSMGWKVVNGAHNWMRAAYLGAASISAISDPAFLAATAKVKGLNSWRALGNYGKLLVPGSGVTKGLAKRAGFIADTINGATFADSRFAGEHMGGGFTRVLAGMTNKLSGLHAMTKAVQDAVGLEGLATLAEQSSKRASWEKLEPDLRNSLSEFGFTKADWNDLKKVNLYDTGKGAKFVFTDDVRVSKNLDPNRAAEIANKMGDWLQNLRRLASNEPDLSTRSITTGEFAGAGAGGRNTISGAAARSLFMFKSFPITVMGNHMIPAIQRITQQGKWDHAMITALGTTMLGGVAIQAKDFVKGKTPQDMDPGFFAAAMMQGGGLGLMGDFFLKDYSRFGRGLVGEMAGPVAGTIDDVVRATKGNFDRSLGEKDSNFLRDTFRIMKRNIPLGSLWYGRLIVERAMLDNIERLIDPKFDRNMHKIERKMMKEQGQEFWWK